MRSDSKINLKHGSTRRHQVFTMRELNKFRNGAFSSKVYVFRYIKKKVICKVKCKLWSWIIKGHYSAIWKFVVSYIVLFTEGISINKALNVEHKSSVSMEGFTVVGAQKMTLLKNMVIGVETMIHKYKCIYHNKMNNFLWDLKENVIIMGRTCKLICNTSNTLIFLCVFSM